MTDAARSGTHEPQGILRTKAKGELHFGTVKDGSGDRYYGFQRDLYDEAVMPFSKQELCIARIPRKNLLWLATAICEALTEDEWDDLCGDIEAKAEAS